MTNISTSSRLHLVGSVVPPDCVGGNSAISQAGNLCQQGVISGLSNNPLELGQVVSYFPNMVFPKGRTIYFKGLRSQLNGGVEYVAVPYVNLPLARALTVNLAILFHLWRTVKPGDAILFYNVTLPSGLLGMILRWLKGTSFFAMIYDIHVPGQTVPDSFRWKFEFLKHKWLLPRANGIIAISPGILEDFACDKNGIVMEGGVTTIPEIPSAGAAVAAGSTFTMGFAGRLNEYNGLQLVLEAMKLIDDPALRLVVAGDGPLRSSVEEASRNDSRITYRGLLRHSDVLAMYGEVQLLLCIRVTKNIHTGYFFPSKLIECLATGIPVLTTSVRSQNIDLDRYARVVTEESAAGVAQGILRSMSCASDDMAVDAKRFIANNMTWRKQGEKLVSFILGCRSSTSTD